MTGNNDGLLNPGETAHGQIPIRNYGELDIPILQTVTDIATNFNFSLALQSDGTVIGWGDNIFGQTDIPEGLSNVVDISAGHYAAAALLSQKIKVKNKTVVVMISGGNIDQDLFSQIVTENYE